jgi:hypothetical protein
MDDPAGFSLQLHRWASCIMPVHEHRVLEPQQQPPHLTLVFARRFAPLQERWANLEEHFGSRMLENLRC